MKQKRLSILPKLYGLLVVVLFAACQSDTDDIFVKNADDPIVFGATVRQIAELRTRATDEYKGLDSVFIASKPYNMDFFIQLCCEDDDKVFSKIKKYRVPSGYEGQLRAKDDNNVLNWHDLTSDHTFYAWNIPWIKTTASESGSADTGGTTDTETTDDTWGAEDIEWKTNADGTIKSIPIYFHNSAEADGFDEYANDTILKYFIGAKSVPHSYKEYGKYVDLTFYHLVSKITIGSLTLIESNGAIQEHLKADITFVGMPTKADFYPHPQNGGRPYVGNPTKSLDDGVTYFIDNEATSEDEFYICPEIDFSKINFKIKLNNKLYENFDTYYGTFDDVEFERTPGWAYDEGEDKDSKILHAGEMMTLDIVLIPGIGPGLKIVIDKWSTDKPVESEYHTNLGVYSDAEVKDIIDVFFNQKSYNDDEIKAELERLFEMYGRTDDEGNRYFPLYEDVAYNSNILPIWKDYILDGMGHTITMKSNGNNTSYVSAPYFNVGPVRDVYLTDGTNTIYIDINGYVWIYDHDVHNYVWTDNQLTQLTGDEKSYDISCKDGKVHKSTYYNNGITGS